jgi:hypothetical protein
MALSIQDQKKLIEAQIVISENLKYMRQNLEKLNDMNVLHIEHVKVEHQGIVDKLTVMTAKYWWLIIVLIIMLGVAFGIKEAFQFFPAP